MKHLHVLPFVLAACWLEATPAMAADAGAAKVPAPTSGDALLNLLEKKGILSTQEAKELRQEAGSDFSRAFAAKTGMPSWVTALKFNGDFRGRFEKHNVDNSLANDRNRFRYRMRFGVTASLLDDFEVGLRLSSGNPTGAFGGNPLSANTDLGDNASRKFLWVDAAYAKWSPLHTANWSGSVAFGKLDLPFSLSPMVFDPDYQPEGFGTQLSYTFDARHTLKFNGGLFILDEINQAPGASRDPFMFGGQLQLDSKWTPKLESSLTVAMLGLGNKENLGNAGVPNLNDGNTRTAAGNLANNYNPLVAGGAVTYKFDAVPLYHGVFPVKLAGEVMHNPGAAAQNDGWWGGVTLGKSGRKGLWDISYKYEHLEADAWYEEFADDDFGGYYQAGAAGSGNAAGYRGGTNVEGHVFKASYSLTDSLTFGVTYYLTELINPVPAGSRSSAGHFMVDLMWKF